MRPLPTALVFCAAFCILVPTAAAVTAFRTDDEDDDDEPLPDTDLLDNDVDLNATEERGMYLGSRCEFTCNPNLYHVYCDPITGKCECEKKFPVKLGPTRGCAKPKRLGEQCYYMHTCAYSDQHSTCIQVEHNAICQCKAGYHMVTVQKPSKKVFCTEDLVLLTTNLSTLAGVVTGIAVLAGLICFVLKLFTQARYSDGPSHFANANMAPPILFSSETGIPLATNSYGGRSASRSSQRSGGSTLISGYSRRTSTGPGYRTGMGMSSGTVATTSSRAGAARAAAILLISCQGAAAVLREENDQQDTSQSAPASPGLGSRRPSLTSIHSASSIRSFGCRLLERERELKEHREMQLRLARMTSLPGSLPRVVANPQPPTPSPLSTDELLPSVSELREVTLAIDEDDPHMLHGEIGPCSSKDCQ